MDKTLRKDRRGWTRSPVTLPEYRRGKPAVNKGAKLPAELLTPGGVKALIDSFDSSPTGRRNRAMVMVMYRAALKMGQVVSLERHHYDRHSGELTVPATRYKPGQALSLDVQTRQALDDWMDARKRLGIRLSAPLFCVVIGPTQGYRINSAYVREVLRKHAAAISLDRRASAEGIRRSGIEHRARSHNRVAAHLEQYLDAESFELRFPDAFEQWESGLDLYTANPTRHADRIGHDCRAAMFMFIDAALAARNLDSPEGSGLVDRLRHLIADAGPNSKAVSAHVKALVSYWRAISGLANRQEHDAQREGEALGPEDSQRLIFYTLLVMLEIDRALTD